ncbi:hypothetical protein I4F81_011729 [Pyropia yezoensis]|uniref:Uncharacterized protein n=1 Tax=Pyropia yezoensis TaxID=2788 RepID=A0ACC3CGB6_PYRYE|nr:hypothetical protein I4F81_011729 [Neopyropia yezoensis]
MFLRGPFIPLSHQANDAAYQAVRSARHVLRPSLHWTLLTSLLPYTHAHLGTLLPSQQPWATALGLTLLPPPLLRTPFGYPSSCLRASVSRSGVCRRTPPRLFSERSRPPMAPSRSWRSRGRAWCRPRCSSATREVGTGGRQD